MIAAIVLAILVIFTADILILRAREAGLQVLEPLKALVESFGVLVGESSRRTPVENAVLCTYAVCKYGCNSVDFAKYAGLEFDGYVYCAGRKIDVNSCSQLCEVYRNNDMFYDRDNERFCNIVNGELHSGSFLILDLGNLNLEEKKLRKKSVIESFTNDVWCMANELDEFYKRIGGPIFNFIKNNGVGTLKEREDCKTQLADQTSYNIMEINRDVIRIRVEEKQTKAGIPGVAEATTRVDYIIQIYP